VPRRIIWYHNHTRYANPAHDNPRMKVIIVLALILIHVVAHAAENVINVVLMGATGNLAQKYLWQSLRNIEDEGSPITVWPAATRPNVQKLIDTILTDNVTYPKGASDKQKFLARVAPYQRLAEPADYIAVDAAIDKRNKGKKEVGRLFYLSVPPKAFAAIAKEINEHLRPDDGAWLKVVVEKPFGVDLNSALELARDLFASLKEHEVLCVDHYMGKDGVRAIREFREANPMYLTHSFVKKIEKVEIQMVETEDCKGRTSFYDEVGVIRDTMQNHLMMMLSLLTMDENKQEEESLRRTMVVGELEALTDASAVQLLGQYEDYKKHIEEDYEAYYSKKMTTTPESVTPTYAKVMLRFKSSSDYRGVSFIMTSGKALKKRRAFLRIHMKGGVESLTFNVQGQLEDTEGVTQIKDAAVHATSGLAEFEQCPKGWTKINSRHCQGPKQSPNAYQVLLSDAIHGRFDSFVSIPEVLQSWRVWSPLLHLNPSSFSLTEYQPGGLGLNDELNGVPDGKEEL
jgi:hexose-6-phosphate dehydrogenase